MFITFFAHILAFHLHLWHLSYCYSALPMFIYLSFCFYFRFSHSVFLFLAYHFPLSCTDDDSMTYGWDTGHAFVALCTTYAVCFAAFLQHINSYFVYGRNLFSYFWHAIFFDFYIGAIYSPGNCLAHFSAAILKPSCSNDTCRLYMLCMTCHARDVTRSIDDDVRSS